MEKMIIQFAIVWVSALPLEVIPLVVVPILVAVSNLVLVEPALFVASDLIVATSLKLYKNINKFVKLLSLLSN